MTRSKFWIKHEQRQNHHAHPITPIVRMDYAERQRQTGRYAVMIHHLILAAGASSQCLPFVAFPWSHHINCGSSLNFLYLLV